MIRLKTEDQIEKIKKAGKIIAKCQNEVEDFLKEGVTTLAIDIFLNKIICSEGGRSAAKGFRGFPGYTCISVNSEVVHGIPNNYKIQSGDVVSIDMLVSYQGFIADACKTHIVGKRDSEIEHLVRETKNAFWVGIKEVKEGVRLSNVSHAIESHAKKHNLSIVKEFCGHGVGFEVHEEPLVPNYGKKNRGPVLQEGMVLAIEPIFCLGSPEVGIKGDNWTYFTKARGIAAHYEHTIAVTKEGCIILTE